MKFFEVRFNVNNKPGGSVMIEARDTAMAKRMALGEIQSQPGYSNKKITIQSASEIR